MRFYTTKTMLIPQKKPIPFILPFHIRVIYRHLEEGRWEFLSVKPFYNPRGIPNDLEEYYGLTKANVVVELFRVSNGKEGWYLANLRDRRYYYCGLTRESVRETLRNISP